MGFVVVVVAIAKLLTEPIIHFHSRLSSFNIKNFMMKKITCFTSALSVASHFSNLMLFHFSYILRFAGAKTLKIYKMCITHATATQYLVSSYPKEPQLSFQFENDVIIIIIDPWHRTLSSPFIIHTIFPLFIVVCFSRCCGFERKKVIRFWIIFE